MSVLRPIVMALLAGLVPPAAHGDEAFEAARAQLLREIAWNARETAAETGVAAFSDRVTAAMGKVPRHLFVPPDQVPHAYENRPLPIGHGQTISQPYIVALMTELLDLAPGARVLEIGTGSGYQAAVLAELGARVYTIEIVEPVGRMGAKALRDAGYAQVQTRIGDGYLGWPEAAPFDAIIVTAAAPEVPTPLAAQLAPGGRMVVPVGPAGDVQNLMVLEKDAKGRTTARRTILVRFVPLTRLRD